jgi:hypothetical protein
MTIEVINGGFQALNFYQNDDARVIINFADGDLAAYSNLVLEIRRGTRLDSPLVKRLVTGEGLTIESTTRLSADLTTDKSGVFWLALVGQIADGIGTTLARGKIIVTSQITRL